MRARAAVHVQSACVSAGAALLAVVLVGCKGKAAGADAGAGVAQVEAQVVAPVVVTTQPSRRGMVWIPPGVLVMGTPKGVTPRIADEELPGEEKSMTGYFVDKLPYPNEPGAIATTNVTREEAERLCAKAEKRLCSEAEWERACKGPQQEAYVGGAFSPATCGIGVAADRAALQPRGASASCVSAFGVADMHGGAFEWTSSTWKRSGFGEQAVVRGGNAALPQGELVARCANGAPRSPHVKSPTVGFRCCAGERNEVEVSFKPARNVVLERVVTREGMPESLRALAKEEPFFRAWHWRPSLNDDLLVHSGCASPKGPCSLVVGREVAGTEQEVVRVELGRMPAEVQLFDGPRTLRATYMDAQGRSRQVRYDLGRVTISDPVR
jgi:formylglycine-generating enzyme required for sulfatase activity